MTLLQAFLLTTILLIGTAAGFGFISLMVYLWIEAWDFGKIWSKIVLGLIAWLAITLVVYWVFLPPPVHIGHGM